MADFSSSIMSSSEHLAVRGKATSSSVASANRNWEGAGGMDGITVVRIDDTHIADEQSHDGVKVKGGAGAYYEMEYSMPAEEEVVGEEDEDGVYVIEYSNPEEEGESYQFTMSVDRSLPPKKSVIKQSAIRDNTGTLLPKIPKPQRPQRPRQEPRKRRLIEEDDDIKEEQFISNKCVLELGEDYSDLMKMNDGKKLVCSLCPPPGRFFKRGSGLAVHLKQMHQLEGKKTFFCTTCNQKVRTQIELDAHTKRHANQDTVFTCVLCPAAGTENKSETDKTGFKGSKWALRKHMEKDHPGVIPNCNFCNKSFKTVMSYLADQFRHIGVTPYHCAKCQIYEMTERGLRVHIINHDKEKKKKKLLPESEPQVAAALAAVENSATDDSDF